MPRPAPVVVHNPSKSPGPRSSVNSVDSMSSSGSVAYTNGEISYPRHGMSTGFAGAVISRGPDKPVIHNHQCGADDGSYKHWKEDPDANAGYYTSTKRSGGR